jgi:hypothetical protein
MKSLLPTIGILLLAGHGASANEPSQLARTCERDGLNEQGDKLQPYVSKLFQKYSKIANYGVGVTVIRVAGKDCAGFVISAVSEKDVLTIRARIGNDFAGAPVVYEVSGPAVGL